MGERGYPVEDGSCIPFDQHIPQPLEQVPEGSILLIAPERSNIIHPMIPLEEGLNIFHPSHKIKVVSSLLNVESNYDGVSKGGDGGIQPPSKEGADHSDI